MDPWKNEGSPLPTSVAHAHNKKKATLILQQLVLDCMTFLAGFQLLFDNSHLREESEEQKDSASGL